MALDHADYTKLVAAIEKAATQIADAKMADLKAYVRFEVQRTLGETMQREVSEAVRAAVKRYVHVEVTTLDEGS
jgi:pyruvate-formate lyase-activating enzyme